MEDAENDPIKRSNLILDIVRSIAIIPEPIVRAEYVKECSNLLHVNEEILYHEINKLKRKESEKKLRQNDISASSAEQKPHPVSPQEMLNAENQKFEEEERNILQVLIKYGKSALYYSDEENRNPITVEDFIIEDLEQDQLEFIHPLYAQMLQEYKNHCFQKDINIQNFFLHHTHSEISKLTADLISEKYTLSKIYKKTGNNEPEIDKIREFAERAVLEYKNSIILSQIRQKLLEMKIAAENHDDELVRVLMIQISQLEEIKNQLAKNLGERIVVKL